MGLTPLEICNHALLKVGADTIDTLTSPTSTEDGTKRSIDLCNIFFDQAYEEVLRIYPWNSAKKRTKLCLNSIDEHIPASINVVGSNVLDVNGKYIYDSTSAGYNIFVVSGTNRIENDGGWKIYGSLDQLAASNANEGENGNPPLCGWTVSNQSEGNTAPTLEFNNLFGYEQFGALPSDLLRLIDIFRYEDQRDERTAWVVEGGYILSDYDTLYLKYIAKPEDTTTLDPLCTNAVICMLAMKLCVALQLDDDWSARIENELYGRILPQARSIDTFENKELLLEESSWLLSRDLDYPVI